MKAAPAGSITVIYRRDGDVRQSICGAVFDFYKIAEIRENSYVNLISGLDVSSDTRASDIRDAVVMAYHGRVAGGASYHGTTDEEGFLQCRSMEQGVYLGTESTPASGYRASVPFIFNLPTEADGTIHYDIQAEPKPARNESSPDTESGAGSGTESEAGDGADSSGNVGDADDESGDAAGDSSAPGSSSPAESDSSTDGAGTGLDGTDSGADGGSNSDTGSGGTGPGGTGGNTGSGSAGGSDAGAGSTDGTIPAQNVSTGSLTGISSVRTGPDDSEVLYAALMAGAYGIFAAVCRKGPSRKTKDRI